MNHKSIKRKSGEENRTRPTPKGISSSKSSRSTNSENELLSLIQNQLLLPYPDSNWFRYVRRKLLGWYTRNQRRLPWRESRDLYRIWVSEIMLQQTQVQTVVEYFNRFMEKFPDVQSLAKASEQRVLSLWEGLGYYRRARNLHRCAKTIVEKFGGRFPAEYRDVLELPGIGRYTAGAILSIAHDQQLPVLEGNTYRLYSRLIGLCQNPREKSSEKLLWQFAADLLPRKHSGEMNQALMELGSEICRPKNPSCTACPLQSRCAARQSDLQNELPVQSEKIQYQTRKDALIAAQSGNRFAVRLIPPGEWWSGMYDFVRINLDEIELHHREEYLGQCVETIVGGERESELMEVTTIQHAVTRYRIELNCYRVLLSKSRSTPRCTWEVSSTNPIAFKTLQEIDDLPLNTTARKLLLALKSNAL